MLLNNIKLSLKSIKKSKKTFIYLTSFLFSILFLACVLYNAINSMVSNYYQTHMGKEYFFNTNYTKLNIDETIDILKSIDHVEAVIKQNERFSTVTIDLEEKTTVLLMGMNEKTLPKIIYGSNDIERKLICPMHLTNDIANVLNDKYINMKDKLGKVKLYVKESQTKIIHEIDTEISGLYDAQINNYDADICFTSFDFVSEINKIANTNLYDVIMLFIDDYENLETVNESIKKNINFDFSLDFMYEIDQESVSNVNNIIYVTAVAIITIIILVEASMIKKNIKNKDNEIKTFKSLGYNNKNILIIYSLQNIIQIIISFVLGLIITSFFIILIKILANNVYFALNNFVFEIPLYSLIFLIIFIVITILITFISLRKIKYVY